jgi:serine/threonine protein kinase
VSVEDQSSLVGQKIDNWRLIRQLGEGGMSVVYLGRHQWLEQEAAIKVLRPEYCRDAAALGRFQQEALAASRLQHENIIEVMNFGRDKEHGYYMILELLHGVDLDLFAEQAPLPKSWILGVMRQICSALHTTHEQKIIHRDLKPSNMFLLPAEPFPKVKLLDFGVAKVHFEATQKKLTSTGVIVGTPAFLAPEQVVPRGELTSACDVYALGVVLYQLFTGELPLHGESTIEHVIKVIQEQPKLAGEIRSDLAGTALEAFLAKMLEKNPADRPQDMQEVWFSLQEAAASFDDLLDIPEYMPDLEAHLSNEAKEARRRQQKSTFATSLHNEEGLLLPTGDRLGDSWGHGEQSFSIDLSSSPAPGQGGLPSAPAPQSQRASGAGKMTAILATLLAFLLTLAGGFAWWNWQSKTPPTKQRKVVVKRSELDQLVLGGMRQFKQKKLTLALQKWRKAVNKPSWKKSRHYPSLYRVIGVAYKNKQNMYNAVRYVDRYLAALKAIQKRENTLRQQLQVAKSKGNKGEEKKVRGLLDRLMNRFPQTSSKLIGELKQFGTWREELKRREVRANQLMKLFEKSLKAGDFAAARKVYQRIRVLLPAHPNVTTRLAHAMRTRFPGLSRRLYQVVVIEMDAEEATKSQAKAALAQLNMQLHADKTKFSAMLKQVDAHLGDGKQRKAHRLLRKELHVDKHLARVATLQLFRAWLTQQQTKRFEQSVPLFVIYRNKWKKLEKKGLQVWMKGRQDNPSSQQLSLQLRVMRRLVRAGRIWKQAEKAAAKGQVQRVVALTRSYLTLWNAIKTIDKHNVRDVMSGTQAKAERWNGTYKRAVQAIQLARRSYAIGRFAQAKTHQQTALRVLSGTPAHARWKAQFERQQRMAVQASGHLRRGLRAMKRLAWPAAKKGLERYLKAFPKAHNAATIRKNIKICRCGMVGVGVPWENCTQERKLIRQMKRRR